MSEFFTPYEGKRPYLFISYSHRNSQEVLETITLLHRKKVRLWYDEGIPAGNDWPKNIETHMRRSAMVLFFLSETALLSPNCLSEIETAVALKKPVLYFTLDDSQPQGRWAELLASCLPLSTPKTAGERASAVMGHKKLKRSFYRRWTEKLPRGLFGFLLSLLLFGAAVVGGYGLYVGWFDRVITEVTATPAPTPTFPSEITQVNFPDEEQERAVRAILGSSEEKIYLQELAAVKALSIVGNLPVADIEHTAFTHEGVCLVNGVKVQTGKVRDLSLIGRMAYLEKLALVNQPLSSPAALSGLVMLSELYLSGNEGMTNLVGLTDLPRLEILHLEHSGVRDLSPLAALPSLKTVTVSADMLPLTWPADCHFTVVLVP
ncbi:MAG: TIR domain-containing protein [Clostridia bacterium]|nr:TIR domain-containing protein [Clostridia bacterium]